MGLLALVAGPLLLAAASVPAVADAAGFGFRFGSEGFAMVARAEGGAPNSVAGSHPYSLTAHVGLSLAGESEGVPGGPSSEGDLRDLRFDMPAGLLLNSQAVAPWRCTTAQFNTPRTAAFGVSQSGENCPDANQVGTVDVRTGPGAGGVRRFGIFNLTPEPGFPAELGFAPFGNHVALGVRIDPGSEGRYQLALELEDFPQALHVQELDFMLWGVPWAASHDGERGDCLNEAEPAFPWAKCSVGKPATHAPLAYLTMPTECGAPLVFTATATSWQPGEDFRSYVSEVSGHPLALGGCAGLRFETEAFGQLTDRKASSSSGFSFDLLDSEQGLTEPEQRIRSQVRQAVVKLPDGVTVNPSLGVGLGACTLTQFASESAAPPPGSGCPNQSKIGDFTVSSPLFEGAIKGGIYLAQPDDRATVAPGAENRFDALVAVYLIARSAQRGILIKVPGRIDADRGSGQLTAHFDDLPQLPYTELEVNFRTGQRAPLIAPASCGPATTTIALVPWAGLRPPTTSTTSSQIESGIGGGPCPRGTPPFAPGVIAGSVNSNVGSYTPFYLHLTRNDTEQEITSYSAVLPRGLTGRLAGVPFCSEAAIAASRLKTGTEETAHPSCPAASQVGRTLSGYGVGVALAYAPGRIYLAGPYHGSPLSLVTVNAATVGPFDLGTIVIRSAFEVDPATAQLRIDSRGSDPIPHILEGIVLHLRDIRLFIDRPQFARNPTSCEPSAAISTLTGSGARFGDPADDSSVSVSNHFQLLNCRSLDFHPRLGLRLLGGSRRGDYPALRAVFAARPGDANLKRIAVTMPHSQFLAQNHIRSVCTKSQFAAEACPPGSIYGRAVAHTPLFDQPLRGPVYLRSSSNRLPDLVASLHSGAVHIVLAGQIGPARNGIRTLFSDLPDAEISRFVLQLQGGRRGLLVNSANICAAPPTATVKALGQNNVGAVLETTLRGQCTGKGRGGR